MTTRTELIARLRNGSNWLIQGYGDYKDCVSKHDRSPFDSADMLGADAIETERLTLGWNAANVDVLHHAMTIASQRKVLEQAMSVLLRLKRIEGIAWEGSSHKAAAKAITAINEVLK
jgi:hypothetical protein